MAHSMDFGGTMRNGHARHTLQTTGTVAAEKDAVRPRRRQEAQTAQTAKEAPTRKDKRAPVWLTSRARRPAPRPGGRPGAPCRALLHGGDADPLDTVVYERRSSTITNPDGSIVFKMEGAEVPATLEPARHRHPHLEVLPQGGPHGDKDQAETSVRQVVHRLAHTIRTRRRLRRLLRHEDRRRHVRGRALVPAREPVRRVQLAGLVQPGALARVRHRGLGRQLGVGRPTGTVAETKNAYERPQCSACFIQAAKDDLMSIYDLIKAEARLFKYGSGTGSNFSAIRGKQEKLSGGGTSSGLMSFLEVFDRAAGATKSGGTTRRAAKMVCLDMDHPEIADFIGWKVREEKKAHALIAAGIQLRLQRRGVPHDQRAELEQQHPRDRRVHARRRGRAASGRRASARRARSARRSRRRTSGARSPRRRGAAPTPACSTTRPSTSGTRARTRGASTRRTRARSTCSSTTRRATWRASTSPSSCARTAPSTSRATATPAASSSSRRRSWSTSRATRRRHRQEQPRLPAARPRLRQPRQPAHVARRAVRQPRGPRDRGGAHGHHVRARLPYERRDGRQRRGPSPASRRTASPCCA